MVVTSINDNNSIDSTMASSTNIAGETGIGRMTDADYDVEYGTPRPKGDMPPSDPQGVTFRPWTFTQAAAAAAAEHKSKRFTTSRTEYRIGNKHVLKAFDDLEATIQRQGGTLAPSDVQLLKQAICSFRVRIIVHDSITLAGLKKMQARCAHESVEHTAMVQAVAQGLTVLPEFATLDAKVEFIQRNWEKNVDLVHWNTTLSNEIIRLERGAERVPPQHVQLARSSGITLQNVLSPQTIRRRFVSLSALTIAIRTDVQEFLTSSARGKDRATVVEQIKKSCAAAKKKAKAAVSAPAH